MIPTCRGAVVVVLLHVRIYYSCTHDVMLPSIHTYNVSCLHYAEIFCMYSIVFHIFQYEEMASVGRRSWEEDYVLKQAFSALVPAFDPRPGRSNISQIQSFEVPPPGICNGQASMQVWEMGHGTAYYIYVEVFCQS